MVSDPRFVRATETGATIADASKAELELGRVTTSFEEVIAEMVDTHIAAMTKSQRCGDAVLHE